MAVRIAVATILAASARAHDDCVCLNWKHLYQTGKIGCGAGLEYFSATRRGMSWIDANATFNKLFCQDFFPRIDDNFCVNVDFTLATTDWTGLQWCYVSPKCKPRTMSSKAGELLWKQCTAEDTLLRSKTPEQLDSIRATHDIDMGLLSKFAFPIWKNDTWPTVSEYFLGSSTPNQQHSHEELLKKRPGLAKVIEANTPVIFDSTSDGHLPYHVVKGKRVYMIHRTRESTLRWEDGHFGRVSELTCIKGCNLGGPRTSFLLKSVFAGTRNKTKAEDVGTL